MIAEVYPIARMPRTFGFFDYEIPEGVDVRVGSMVRIPFRTREMSGVVSRLKDTGDRGIKLKRMIGLIPAASIFSESELLAFKDVARDTAQSVSTILHAAIPTNLLARRSKPKNVSKLQLTIPANEAPVITRIATQLGMRSAAFVYMPDLRRSCVLVQAYAREHPDEPILVLVPNVRDARLVSERLSGNPTLVVTGEESALERACSWTTWRSSNSGILVATRTGALWTHPRLGAIFVLRSGHQNHKQDDRNPRLDVRATTRILCTRLHARLVFADVAPSAEVLYRVGAENLLGFGAAPAVRVADMTVERQNSPHPCIGQSAVLDISQALSEGKRVLCSYNAKGNARRLRCSDCKYGFPCDRCGGLFVPDGQTVCCRRCGRVDPTPLSCPSCGGSKLVARGYGNRAVASALQAIFPETTVECVEKGSLPGTAPRPDILLATRHYIENIFDPFDPEAFGLVTELDADRPLYEPSTFAVERAVIGSHEWMGVANACRADVLFQTEAVELTREILAHPEQVVAGDIETRRSYGQPPFSRSVDARYTSDEPLKRSQALHILADQIRQAVPRARLSESEELHISVPLEDEAPLLDVLLRFDDRYIIDTRPIG